MFTGDLSAVPVACNLAATYHPIFAKYVTGLTVLIPIIVMIIYVATALRVRKSAAAVSDSRSALSAAIQRQAKVNTSIAIILLIYIIVFGIPLIVWTISIYANMPAVIQGILGPFTALGLQTNCVANFFVYSLKIPGFRSSLRGLLSSSPTTIHSLSGRNEVIS